MTTAQTISTILGNDGQRWTTLPPSGRTFDTLVEDAHARIEQDSGPLPYRTRYSFPDGSVLTVAGAAWDLGFPECWCWAGCLNDDCGRHS
jgi:hypothetical protein